MDLFKDIEGSVVEIGPGTGINFQYLPSGINWIGIEPNEAFHDPLRKGAEKKGINLQLLTGEASEIPLPDNSADVLISTLVLCTAKKPSKVLNEIKRVLKPGGKFIFIEHVAAPRQTKLRGGQNFFNPINRVIGDGCNCNRETWNWIQEAGFADVQLMHVKMKGTLGHFDF